MELLLLISGSVKRTWRWVLTRAVRFFIVIILFYALRACVPHGNLGLAGSNDGKVTMKAVQSHRVDLNYILTVGNIENVECGRRKCFFKIKGDSNMGYLIQPERGENNISTLELSELTWNYARELENQYKVSTLMLRAPYEVYLDRNTTEALGELAREALTRAGRNDILWRHVYSFKNCSDFIVQESRPAPEHSDLFKCKYWTHSDRFNQSEEILSHIQDKDAFLESLGKDMALVRTIVDDQKFDCLKVYDFQIIIDASGHFHYIDLDRCIHASGSQCNVTAYLSHLEEWFSDKLAPMNN